ncbi:MAG: GPW/gp25 family protein [Betaproteobacteria bacterium]|nr:GPW/gp25 family protein [Betaproteobacteria bacterium]
MTGMSRANGKSLTGQAHLEQSIIDIITTPLGSRRMRPEYGSQFPRMVDLPVTKGWVSAVQAEIARAVGRWEPRISISRVEVTSVLDGKIGLRLTGDDRGEALLLELRL